MIDPSSNRFAQVLRLTTALSEQVLDAQIMKRPVPNDQVRALAGAALLLDEHRIPLPSMLKQVLHEIGVDGVAAVVSNGEPASNTGLLSEEDEADATKLAWLLRPFQKRD